MLECIVVTLGGLVMIVLRHKNALELGKDASRLAALKINQAISDYGSARIILSTGASQFVNASITVSPAKRPPV